MLRTGVFCTIGAGRRGPFDPPPRAAERSPRRRSCRLFRLDRCREARLERPPRSKRSSAAPIAPGGPTPRAAARGNRPRRACAAEGSQAYRPEGACPDQAWSPPDSRSLPDRRAPPHTCARSRSSRRSPANRLSLSGASSVVAEADAITASPRFSPGRSSSAPPSARNRPPDDPRWRWREHRSGLPESSPRCASAGLRSPGAAPSRKSESCARTRVRPPTA